MADVTQRILELIRIMQAVCVLGGTARIVYCMALIMHGEDGRQENTRRAKHALIFIVLAAGALELANAALGYFGAAPLPMGVA